MTSAKIDKPPRRETPQQAGLTGCFRRGSAATGPRAPAGRCCIAGAEKQCHVANCPLAPRGPIRRTRRSFEQIGDCRGPSHPRAKPAPGRTTHRPFRTARHPQRHARRRARLPLRAMASVGEGSVVAHVVVVGFHAQLGNRIEFAYPRLRGEAVLRSPRPWDTSDISADVASPSRRAAPRPDSAPDWGALPDEWAFLPFMALPDGVHDSRTDVVFFTLPPDVHCVSCFRQVDAVDAKTHSAASGNFYECGVAARGSVQKSVVLLCRRPLFGVLADRLVPAVRAYFDQGDFARTDVLASLYHSLNVSLARPSLNDAPTLFHGLDLRAVLRKLGPQTLAVLKLIMLERRVIVYSQPVHHASNAVVALASVFAGALDTIAPNMPPLDTAPDTAALGLPLALFSPDDRVTLQPYAPLPLVSELIPNHSHKACLIGTSHNVGLLLSSTAASAARKAAATKKDTSATPTPVKQSVHAPLQYSGSTPLSFESPGPKLSPMKPSRSASTPAKSPAPTPDKSATPSPPPETPEKPARGNGGVPVVDALVNLSNGKVSVSGSIEPFCRITRTERRFMRDLMVSASTTSASVTSSGAYVGSDDYIRRRLREYLNCFLRSAASVDGVLGGPVGAETWSGEMIDDMDFGSFEPYNEQFIRAWMKTRNAAQWARNCALRGMSFQAPPKPELDESLLEETMLPVDRVVSGLSGLRQNVAEFTRFSGLMSSRAAEGISSLFRRIEQEVVKMDVAVGVANTSNPSTPRAGATSTQGSDDANQKDATPKKAAPR